MIYFKLHKVTIMEHLFNTELTKVVMPVKVPG